MPRLSKVTFFEKPFFIQIKQNQKISGLETFHGFIAKDYSKLDTILFKNTQGEMTSFPLAEVNKILEN